MKVHSMSPDPAFRQRFQGLKDTSTVYDVLRIGLVILLFLFVFGNLHFVPDTCLATNGSSPQAWDLKGHATGKLSSIKHLISYDLPTFVQILI